MITLPLIIFTLPTYYIYTVLISNIYGAYILSYSAGVLRESSKLMRRLAAGGVAGLAAEADHFTLPTLTRYSAICTALRAAPLRIWSPVSQRVMPLSSAMSLRTRPTKTSSLPADSRGMG